MARQLSDWLEHYMAFTENTEPPRLYHLWSGLTAISSALRRKCYTNWGSNGYLYPNLYVCLVGPPGGRKGTAMKKVKPMIEKLKIPIGSDAVGSVQTLYKQIMNAKDAYKDASGIMKEHRSLSIWSEEFQVFLSDRDPKLIASLTDLFDCADSWKYDTLSRGVENLSSCFLTLIGAITPSLLQAKLTSDAVGGGLISRIIFVVGYGREKTIAIPIYTEQELIWQKQLSNDLQEIAKLTGPFRLETPYLKIYAKWYEGMKENDGVKGDKFLGYNSRRPMHLNKVAMLISASESDDMILLPRHFNKALAVMEATEVEMVNAFQGFGGGAHANTIATIFSWIEKQEKFSYTAICNKFYLEALPSEMSVFMQVAEQRGLVKKSITPSEIWYTVQKKEKESRGYDYLNKTVFRLMSENLK